MIDFSFFEYFKPMLYQQGLCQYHFGSKKDFRTSNTPIISSENCLLSV